MHLAAYNHFSPPVLQQLVCAQSGATPLIAASGNGHTDVVKELLSRGADIGQADEVGVCVAAPLQLDMKSCVLLFSMAAGGTLVDVIITCTIQHGCKYCLWNT